MSTITGTAINHGITIGNSGSYTYPSQLTIASDGAVSNNGAGNAVYSAIADPALYNQGTISATGFFHGVNFVAGGYVGNTGTGLIKGDFGVVITGGAGTVTNSATIVGASGSGVELNAGGYVGNTGTGLIKGFAGVYIRGTAGTVTNSATILGTSSISAGVFLDAGGYVGNTGTGLIKGRDGVYIYGGAGTVANTATITGTARFQAGVYLTAGGYVGNAGTGLIEGYNGVYITGTAGTVTNSATIVATSEYGNGVELTAGGSVGNTGTGLVEGFNGVHIGGGAGTVINSGTIAGTSGESGVYLAAGGVANTGTGLITGYRGVYIQGGAGTVTNSGTIAGTSGSGVDLRAGGTVVDSGTITGAPGVLSSGAISFGGTGANLLVLQRGYAFNGDGVVGSSGATNTVELAGSVGAAVTASYTALGLTHFQDLLFGVGGNDTFDVANTSGTPGLTISGFGGVGDIIDLTAIGTNGTIASQSSTEVTVTGSTGTVTLLLGSDNGANFGTVSDGASGTDLTPCFRRGTLILTPDGEAAVEELAIGDKVVTLSGMARPIKWIGHRAYDPRFVAGNRAVLPIRVEAGVVGDGVPARDLWVSPEHALHIDGLLVPARLLVNGITIRQVESFEQLEYFHIELDSHDVIFADGAPAESFGDTDNRFMFHNAAEFAALYPDGPPQGGEFCAPRVAEDSAELTAIRAALLERAEALGRTTRDPGLHLVADGDIVRAASGGGGIYQFGVAAGTCRVALVSRSAVPAEVYPSSLDGRALGVPVERIELRDAGLRVEIGHNSAALGNGFHDDEAAYRWSDGRGCLPEGLLGCFAGDIAIEVHLAPSALIYPCDPAATAAELDATEDLPLSASGAVPTRKVASQRARSGAPACSIPAANRAGLEANAAALSMRGRSGNERVPLFPVVSSGGTARRKKSLKIRPIF